MSNFLGLTFVKIDMLFLEKLHAPVLSSRWCAAQKAKGKSNGAILNYSLLCCGYQYEIMVTVSEYLAAKPRICGLWWHVSTNRHSSFKGAVVATAIAIGL